MSPLSVLPFNVQPLQLSWAGAPTLTPEKSTTLSLSPIENTGMTHSPVVTGLGALEEGPPSIIISDVHQVESLNAAAQSS
jgi:hypothetical protein